MPSLRRFLEGLDAASCDHPYLAFERLMADCTAKGDEKRIHQEKALQRSLPEKLKDAYGRAFRHREQALGGYTGGIEGAVTRSFSLPVQGRLAAGLGNASVLQNGLSLNHTFGLPYLPGTGLKGMASAMAHLGLAGPSWQRGVEMDGAWTGQGADHKVLFGTMDTGAEDAAAGMVIFHDAWWDPTGETRLPFQPDVMTPHQDGYNLDGAAWPNDWTAPIPVPFVTCGGTFRVWLTGPEAWLEAAFEILKMAFKHLGFGAKTQIGYGRGELEAYLSAEEKSDLQALAAKQQADAVARDRERQAVAAQDAAREAADREAARLQSLPQEVLRGVLKPVRAGGVLQARLEVGAVVFTLDHAQMLIHAGDLTQPLWSRLENGREPRVLATLVTDDKHRKVIRITLPV